MANVRRVSRTMRVVLTRAGKDQGYRSCSVQRLSCGFLASPIANARGWLADLSRLKGGEFAKRIGAASVDAQPDLQDQLEGGESGLTSKSHSWLRNSCLSKPGFVRNLILDVQERATGPGGRGRRAPTGGDYVRHRAR